VKPWGSREGGRVGSPTRTLGRGWSEAGAFGCQGKASEPLESEGVTPVIVEGQRAGAM
jgi:hypothetical protein